MVPMRCTSCRSRAASWRRPPRASRSRQGERCAITSGGGRGRGERRTVTRAGGNGRVSELIYRERPPAGPPEGLLVLHHGRGADEHDLLTLADVLDPAQRLHVVTPRAPLALAGSPGHHWYT